MGELARLGAAALAGIALAATVQAQESPTTTAPTVMDATLVVKATSYVEQTAQAGMFEVQSSELALRKSASPQVRAFAVRMVKDHAAAKEKLKQVLAAAKLDVAPPTALDPEHSQMLETLEAASGADFDRAYLKMQTDGHQEALRTQLDYRLHGGSQALQKFADEAATMAQDHLSMLGKISQSTQLMQ